MQRTKVFSSALLVLGSGLGIIAFSWPLYLPDSNFLLFQPDAARIFAILIALSAIGIVSLDISQGALDSKAVALLGVLAALIAALRLIGAGAIGIEPMWFLLIIAGYVFGANFGFALGVLSMAISALLTGGIGPWLPFQMLAAGWIGLLAGASARLIRNKDAVKEKLLLVTIGVFASLAFGALMDLQLWPWIASTDTQLSFIPGASVLGNAKRFMVFHFATALAWDIPRAVTTAALIAFSAKPLLHSFRRAQVRLNFTLHAKQQTASVR